MHIERMMSELTDYRSWCLNYSLRKESSSKRLKSSSKVRYAWKEFLNKLWPRPKKILMQSS